MSITFAASYPTETPDHLCITLANSNAMHVLALLGFEVDYCGTLPASELAERSLLMRALPPEIDAGVSSKQYGRVIDCGTRPGYFSDVATRLEDLARYCLDLGVDVTYA